MKEIKNKATQCVHVGTIVDQLSGGTVSPVYISSAYDYLDREETAYPRYYNTPNQQVVNEKIAVLEKGEAGLVFSSGMAAISTGIFTFLKKGDHAVFQNDLYGGTHNAIVKQLEKSGIHYDFVESLEVEDFEKKILPTTRLIYIETPTNPLLKLIDVQAIAELARSRNIFTMIDNTFASPINQNPISLGIDMVIHSGTKYLAGHSDLCCGAMVTSREIMKDVWNTAINFGGSLNAQMCALLERSLKTLDLRVRKQNENALALAEFLVTHDKVEAVYYPGLKSHPQHELANRQMMGYGGMLSFEVSGDADDFVKKLELIPPAISLGGVETTITSPVQTSHAKMAPEVREIIGIKDNLLRLSVGIEYIDDLIEDLDQALAKL